MRCGFIGLGVMGYPMAGYLRRAGHDVVVYNRTAARATQWCEEFAGDPATTPRGAAESADFVFTCVGNDDDVREVMLGDAGVLAGSSAGSVVVDHTTASAVVAREISAIAGEQSVGFLDAPLSGGQAGAESGQLTIMVGGDEATFEQTRGVMDSYAKCSASASPCRTPAMHTWLTIFASCPQLVGPINVIAFA